MKNVFLILIFIIAVPISAQETPDTAKYEFGGFLQLNMNQLALINWAKGGDQSISGVSRVNLFYNCKSKDYSWENNFDLGYGLMTSEEYPMRKTEDKIDLNSKFGKNAFENFLYTVIFNFKSQFAPGYKYPDDTTMVSNLFSPAYVILSIGMDYQPGDDFSLYFSPISGKAIIVTDQQLANRGAFGVEKAKLDTAGNVVVPGKNARFDFGWYLTAKLKKEIMEDVTIQSKLELFNDYTAKDPGNRLNIDVDWETQFRLKVNDYISANIL
ncbi:MAG: DUF3078 domain-containing protein, partial [Bacteroidota bacterium]